MKIDGKPPIGLEDYIKARVQEVKRKLKEGEVVFSPSARTREGEKVTISEEARQFVSLLQSVKELPEVRSELIQKLKESIEKGTYKVRTKEVATRMILNALEEMVEK
jgi:negative regulator of flagellin synthesis FlgM